MKHAPGAEATVEVRGAHDREHVLVTNPVPRQAGGRDGARGLGARRTSRVAVAAHRDP